MVGIPFKIVNSVQIAAPPARVYALLENFHAWGMWSPLFDLDPEMMRSYSGADSGVGARYEWAGNEEAGAGTMEITAARPHRRLKIAVTHTEPRLSHQRIDFVLTPKLGGTHVEWVTRGTYDGLSYLLESAFDSESPIDEYMARGLMRLREVAEAQHAAAPDEVLAPPAETTEENFTPITPLVPTPAFASQAVKEAQAQSAPQPTAKWAVSPDMTPALPAPLARLFQAENQRDWEAMTHVLHPEVRCIVVDRTEMLLLGTTKYIDRLQRAYQYVPDRQFSARRALTAPNGLVTVEIIDNHGFVSFGVFEIKDEKITRIWEHLVGHATVL